MSDRLTTEEDRIRTEYAARAARPSAIYSVFDRANLLIVQERERAVIELLRRARCGPDGARPLPGQAILDVGCGTGAWIRDFIRWGARPENLCGIDLLPERIREAAAVTPAGVRLTVGSAARLPYGDGAFDIVLQAMVFSSVLDDSVALLIASEMRRVLKPDGFLLWYDFTHDNPRNSAVRGITLGRIRELFPGSTISAERVTLAPPLARAVAPASALLAHGLSLLPFLRTHLLARIEG